MKVLYGPDAHISENTAIAIGKFDGLHIGHKKVIDELMHYSKLNNFKSVIYTFEKNPKLVLNQDNFVPLMTNEEKTKAYEKFGIDYLIYEKFDEKFARLEPERFVKDVLVDKLSVKLVIMGANSTFGNNRNGNFKTMEELGKKYGFDVVNVNMILNNGKVVSSTGIREHNFQ